MTYKRHHVSIVHYTYPDNICVPCQCQKQACFWKPKTQTHTSKLGKMDRCTKQSSSDCTGASTIVHVTIANRRPRWNEMQLPHQEPHHQQAWGSKKQQTNKTNKGGKQNRAKQNKQRKAKNTGRTKREQRKHHSKNKENKREKQAKKKRAGVGGRPWN